MLVSVEGHLLPVLMRVRSRVLPGEARGRTTFLRASLLGAEESVFRPDPAPTIHLLWA